MRRSVFESTSFYWWVVVVNGREACGEADVVFPFPFKVW